MPKIKSVERYNKESEDFISPTGQYMFQCVGCGQIHVVYTKEIEHTKVVWGFNGDINKPTFTPSVRVMWGKYADPNWQEPEEPGHDWSGQCHFVITNGEILFCNDCTHAMAGQTVELPDIIY